MIFTVVCSLSQFVLKKNVPAQCQNIKGNVHRLPHPGNIDCPKLKKETNATHYDQDSQTFSGSVGPVPAP